MSFKGKLHEEIKAVGIAALYFGSWIAALSVDRRLNKPTIKIDRPQLSPTDIKKLQAAQHNNEVSE